MDYTPTELEAFVRQRAPQIAEGIRGAAAHARNEADLVAEVEKLLDRFAENFGLPLRHDRERTLINGRADAVYNRFVIEYEPPGSLRKDPGYRHNQHAIGQVKQYMEGLERLDRHRKERLAGVVLDGSFYIFVRYRDDHWHIDEPVPVSAHSTETFLRYLLSLSTELALTPENLVRDFGENTTVSRLVVRTLYDALGCTDCPKVHVLFQQWQRQFGEVTGWEKQSSRLNLPVLARNFGIQERQPDPLRFFFAMHTYYATFIKVLAVQIAHYYMMPKVGSGLAQVASGSSDELHRYLVKMERGGVFKDFGINNFLEGDFFGWYLDIWDEAIDHAIRRIVADLANYSLVTLDVDPEETRDLLKHLYQNLMPRTLRHALGEYYTPDWLADRVLNQLGYDGNPGKRLLDPACGSGTFLVLAIKRVHRYAEERMLPPAGVLEQVLQNIVGFDLNPLAVISARTNYLLALGDLLQHRRGEISIPVYLADSILTPSVGEDLFTQHAFSFNTAVGRFSVPQSLVNARYIDQLADLLEQSVEVRLTRDQFLDRLLATFPLDADKDRAEIDVALDLYDRLLGLDEQEINGIWARIIKNAFAPLFAGRFDYVAGNPPWINWESLPEDYRQETVSLWDRHSLFQHKGYKAILGGSKDDISVLLTYVAADCYLTPKGKLGFVITQSVFQTAGAGQGFRQFSLGDGTKLHVMHVDDMVRLQPFEGATNRTAVVIIRKGDSTVYPVSYAYWRKAAARSSISESASLDEIEALARVYDWKAEPIDEQDVISPWIVGRPSALRASRKILGSSKYKARKGVVASVNGVFWVDILSHRQDGLLVVSNLSERSKRDVESTQTAIEGELVYPLLQGREVRRWKYSTSSFIILTHREGDRLRAIPEKEMAVSYPRTFSYLKRFEKLLRTSGLFKRYYRSNDPFYSMFNIGDYTFAPYKVVFREISTQFMACVVGSKQSKPVIADHKLVLCPFESETEAHYVCAVLNSALLGYVTKSYTIGTQFSTHVFDYIAVPRFEPGDPVHRGLAVLSQRAHSAVAIGESVKEIEADIDRLAAQLWGLTDEELTDIQQSLAELG